MADHFRVAQVGRKRTGRILSNPNKFKLQSLLLTNGKDGFDRLQYRFQGVYEKGNPLRAFHAMTQTYSAGVRGGLFISVATATCEDHQCKRGKTEAAVLNNPDNPDGAESPQRLFPVGVYVGQLDGDGRPDVLVVFPKGPSLVFSQKP